MRLPGGDRLTVDGVAGLVQLKFLRSFLADGFQTHLQVGLSGLPGLAATFLHWPAEHHLLGEPSMHPEACTALLRRPRTESSRRAPDAGPGSGIKTLDVLGC